MARRRQIQIGFPLGGLDRKRAYRQQRPYTTPDARNVRPVGTLENRERGGSRPGLVPSHQDDLGSSVRLLSPMILAPGDRFTAWSDTFPGTSLASVWAQAAWASNVPTILPSAMISVDYSVGNGAIVRDALPIDNTQVYTVETFLVPWNGAYHGKYRLFLRMNNTAPNVTTEGVQIELIMTGSTGAYSGTLTSYVSGIPVSYNLASGTLGSAQPGWLIAQVTSNTVVVFWNGVQLISQAIPAHTGLRTGCGMECTVEGGLALASVFRCQYYSTGTVTSLRTVLVASANGNIWKETRYGRMTQLSSSLNVRDDVPLTAAQSGQKLYIADYGNVRATAANGTTSGTELDSASYPDWTTCGININTDVAVLSNVTGACVAGTYTIASVEAIHIHLGSAPGNGTCTFRIERAPKIYNPIANTLSLWTATTGKGQVPTGNPLICRHLDRLFLAGAEIAPQVWYASRQGNELDWDYSQSDSQRAVAGSASAAGVPGQAITALVSHNDDYLIIGCRNSLWRLRGDPAYEGRLDSLSHTIGIVGQNAWARGPAGELIFLSLDGIYILPPGGDTVPISISREVLPMEFLNFDPNTVTALLEYDVKDRGVHIYLTQASSNAQIHWWLEWESKTFWPMTISANHEPTAVCCLQTTAIEDTGVILGGRDGVLRRFSSTAESDSGTAYTSYVLIGPIPLAPDAMVGTLVSIDAVMAENSGNVTWEVRPALTFEATATATAISTGTWAAGVNGTVHPAGRGQAFMLKLTNSARRWAVEQLAAIVAEGGKRRIG